MKPSDALPILALAVCTLFLAVWGAGAFASSVCLTAVALCAAAGAGLIGRARAGTARRIPASAFVVVTALLLTLLSAAPLPGRLDVVTGGRRHMQNGLVREALSEAERCGVIDESPSTRFSHTRNRAGTLRISLLILLALCAASITAGLQRDKRNAYLHFLLALLVIMSVLGFLHQWVWPVPKTIWWVFHLPSGSPVGCFVNRTHYAGFIALICPACLALFVKSINERRPVRAGLYAGAFSVVLAAVLFSLARGAVVAVGAGILVVLIILIRRRNRLASFCVVALLLLLAAVGAFSLFIAREKPVVREAVARLRTFAHPTRTFSGRARVTVWRDSLKVWRDYPVTGVGANGFRMVFPSYRTRSDRKTFVTPENEYVEVLVDGGAAGALLAALLGGLLFARWRHGTGRGLLSPEISMGTAGAVAVAAVHSGLDVPVHTPLYAMTLASLVGMVFPAPACDDGRPYLTGPAVHPGLCGAALVAVGLLIGVSALVFGTDPYKRDLRHSIVSADAEELSKALTGAPTSWAVWYHLGRCAFQVDTTAAYVFGEKCMTRATEYDPKNYRLWEALGHTRLNMGYEDRAREAFDRMHSLRSWKKPPKIQSR